jgi:7,8-didemethyl-8-hydroxy-5-deazariboflavin synthase CofG subunit
VGLEFESPICPNDLTNMTSLQAAAISENYGLDRVLHRGETGQSVGRSQALAILRSAPLNDLLESASALRNRAKGRTISFSRKVFLPLTTLCRDRCGYCTFRRDPGEAGAHFMSPEEVLLAARAARKAGCKEALFSLGDQPERAFSEAADFLAAQGHPTTLNYLAAMTEMTLRETGLLPHSNPGLMPAADLAALRRSNASLGLMLESVNPRLLHLGEAHWQAPDKAPRLRLQTIEDAGRLRIPFTTGLLIGIGETDEERVDALLAIREINERHGHIQEVIIQNFRAKPETRMAAQPEPSTEDFLRTIAASRLILGGEMNIQAPPNLSSPDYGRLLDAGINDWGGISPVTPDFINPEFAWPQIAALRETTERAGFDLRERLAIYPEYLRRPEFFADELKPHLARMADADGYARVEGVPVA